MEDQDQGQASETGLSCEGKLSQEREEFRLLSGSGISAGIPSLVIVNATDIIVALVSATIP